MSRSWRRDLRTSEVDSDHASRRFRESLVNGSRNYLRIFRQSFNNAVYGIRGWKQNYFDSNHKWAIFTGSSELGFDRKFITLVESTCGALHRPFTWQYGRLESNEAYRVWNNGEIQPYREWRQFVTSGLGGEPGQSFTRNYFCPHGADVYVDDIWVGFIDFDLGQTTLTNVPVSDGSHVIETRLSKWFWPQTRNVKKLYTKITGGSIVPTAAIPDVINLSYTVVQGGYVIFNWQTNWDNTTDPNFTGFGVWTSLTSPVPISGSPFATIRYNASVSTYAWINKPVSSYYVRVAGYFGSLRGVDQEIYVDVDTIPPVSPPNQYLEIAADTESATYIKPSSSSSSSSSSSVSSSSSSSSFSVSSSSSSSSSSI